MSDAVRFKGPVPFFRWPLDRLVETAAAATTAVRTLPDSQLRAETEVLRIECAGSSGPAALMLSIYDAEAARRDAGRK